MSTRTLLLTPYYMPIKILRWQDAIKMVYEGTVRVVAEYDEEIRSPSISMQMPAVLVIKKLTRRANRGSVKFSRANVYVRDGYLCQYCNTRFHASKLSYDHVVPKSAGGRRTWANIVSACMPCNLRKADRTCDETGMWPLRPPREPVSLPFTGPRIDVETAPAEWLGFLGAAAR
jgi:5-methylcytosine-specific restriction endonuclease McrA